MLSNRSSSNIPVRTSSGLGSAFAWRRARHAALAALALLPAACVDFDPGDGALDDPSELAELSDGEIGEASQELATLPFPIDRRKSLIVTDVDIVSQFSLQQVLQQLITQSGVSGLTPLTLFQRFMDTHRTTATGVFPSVQHCDTVPANTADIYPPGSSNPAEQPTGSTNGWPVLCPRPVGDEATSNPFADPNAASAYMATTLSNRFDLAPPDGSNCGEYRIVFARKGGHPDTNGLQRNFIIFEARLPNPNPSQGRAACLPVAQFWLNQSDPAKSVTTRKNELLNFYFNGLSGFQPVVHIDHYGHAAGPDHGQIRTNEFLNGTAPPLAWSLREFRLIHGTSGSPSLNVVPSFVKDNPAARLFSPAASSDTRVTSFRSTVFPNVVERLAATDDINRFNYPSALPDSINAGESLMIPFQNNYLNALGTGTSTLRTNIANKLTALGSNLSGTAGNLSVDQVVARAQTLACSGCHEPQERDGSASSAFDVGAPSPFPNTLVFTHTSEKTEPINSSNPTGPQRFIISPALINVFLPFREQVLTDYLLNNTTLGFEKPGAWTSPQGLLAVHTGRVTEGISSLEVRTPASFNAIVSPNFSTAGLTPVGNKVKLDLFISKAQPNPSWVGTIEALISIPSAGISNQWIGNVVLNSLTRGGFNVISFSLPSATITALNAAPSDVKLQFNLNVTPNSGPYYLDKVRLEN
ncbi:hypothetical protein SOCE26_066160 [Sorangium cellulosum]|uniref:Uncharacterized protein n=1 Tax=Sorangium cellulosum TaxID=56 RepID=A0A2L0F0Q6_SORCE|nr:hypothetical protein [Sorangium cellulosum]AUX45135.1 hypothetical protein SOCE26_066160 [Sorangium cellulosum]